MSIIATIAAVGTAILFVGFASWLITQVVKPS